MTLRIGCIDFPIPPSRYFRKWDLVEIEQTLVRAPGDGTIKRWLRESEDGFEFVVAASPLVTYGPSSQQFRYQPAPKKSQWRKYSPFAATKEVPPENFTLTFFQPVRFTFLRTDIKSKRIF